MQRTLITAFVIWVYDDFKRVAICSIAAFQFTFDQNNNQQLNKPEVCISTT